MSIDETITADTGLMVDRTVDSVDAADLPDYQPQQLVNRSCR